ncbi:c-type cytochrome [Verrucomicrobia bacterium]|nr:c-type cytochrome [Verrucomicrobiota bacterium]
MNTFLYFRRVALLCLISVSCLSASGAESGGFRVPEGFEVTRYASDELAHDIFAMTTDIRGRVVVAGENYIKTLEDTDGDGIADKAILFSDFPKSGAHGLYFDGKSLLCVGDDGVWRFEDKDGDAVSDDAPVLVLGGIGSRGHAGNGIVRGPDGAFYLICGNSAGVSEKHSTIPGSPVKVPNMGAVIRLPKEGLGSEVLAHGLRNPYDICFDKQGQMFTVDADGERILGLPYYAPNRLFDLAIGMHHGWGLSGWKHSWSRPDYLPDTVEWLNRVGRGSPTGMLAYRHWGFPERYQDGVFSVCWTFGKVYFYPLKRSGSSYTSEREVFMETTGEAGFAPVDMAVHPYGDVFVAIGGRGTEGGVFRVSYKGDDSPSTEASSKALDRVLRAPQPYSSWSRADWLPAAKLEGRDSFVRVAMDSTHDELERVRAIEILADVLGGVDWRIASKLLVDKSRLVASRAIWALGRNDPEPRALLIIGDATRRKSPMIQRAAWEALACWPDPYLQLKTNPDWEGAFGAMDRRIRATAIVAAKGNGIYSLEEVMKPTALPKTLRARLAYLQVYGPDEGPAFQDGRTWQEFYWETCLESFAPQQFNANRLEAMRLMQLGLGDVKLIQGSPSVMDGLLAAAPENLKGNLRARVLNELIELFPTGIGEVDREGARVLAMLKEDDGRQLNELTTSLGTGRSVEDLLYYLGVVAALPGERTDYVSTKVGEAVGMLHQRVHFNKRDLGRVWNERVSDLFKVLMERDSKLAEKVVGASVFGLPGHVLLARALPEELKQKAGRRILDKILTREKAGQVLWTGESIEFIGEMKLEEGLPVVRRLQKAGEFPEAVVRALVSYGHAEDELYVLEGLNSHSFDLVTKVAEGLIKMNSAAGPDKLLSGMKALRRAIQDKRHAKTQKALHRLLVHWTDQKTTVTETGNPAKDYQAWFDWLKVSHPDLYIQVTAETGLSSEKWRARFASVKWDDGDAARGKILFEQRACYACHSGNKRLGPDLKGITKRLGAVDLFLHIVKPELAVSPAYQVSVVETEGGETHSGVLIYDSSVAILLQTSPETTLRFTGDQVKSVIKSTTSLMPTGLLEGLDDGQLADLQAWLKGI